MSNNLYPYNLCSVTPEEAEILNEKIDLFNSRQLSFHGKVEELRNYVIKDKEILSPVSEFAFILMIVCLLVYFL